MMGYFAKYVIPVKVDVEECRIRNDQCCNEIGRPNTWELVRALPVVFHPDGVTLSHAISLSFLWLTSAPLIAVQ
jgi:hypothetical protein